MKTLLLAATALAGSPAAPAQTGQSPSQPAQAAVATVAPTSASTPNLSTTAAGAVFAPPIVQSSEARTHTVPPSPAELRVRAANRAVTRDPAALAFVNAIQVYPYGEGVLYRLFAAPERVTDIALQPGEAVVSVAAGDTVRWTIGDTTSGSGEAKRVHILVKPFSAGLATNLIITTDRRTYHLQMDSTSATAMAAVSWTYPQDELIAIRRQQAEALEATPVSSGLTVASLNFDYAITGDTPDWRPLRAFDDGRQTFIEFPASISVGEAPPLFVLDEKGEASLVNYRMSGRFYVVDRLFGAAELRLGAKKQSIVRIARATPARSGRRRGRAS
ncbi:MULTISPECIES: P-type conjugative transfer protein TrbG [unclassified Sphingomonas]|jgi:type IV secretion system protein TrbG|uniref:P-type conjugative transfer protein TrbG n=1 Tax=unclassified Sphingomonas TaxID=196159 RepID=UPI000A57CE00|nr:MULTISPECIES: P-type conjugative transfer protein TrbG [unclassified Sphingomonas]